MSVVTRRALVTGGVQGVGYRAACAREAARLGVGGHARNLPDGRVEVVASGEAESVGALVEWCRTGPAGARVVDVVLEDAVQGGGGMAGGGMAGEGFRVR